MTYCIYQGLIKVQDAGDLTCNTLHIVPYYITYSYYVSKFYNMINDIIGPEISSVGGGHGMRHISTTFVELWSQSRWRFQMTSAGVTITFFNVRCSFRGRAVRTEMAEFTGVIDAGTSPDINHNIYPMQTVTCCRIEFGS